MPCTDTENTPLPGDTENVLLRKLLNRLCNVTSGGGGGVSQAYVDARDAATLASANATAAAGDAATLAAAMSSASALYVLKAGDTMTGALLQPAGSVGAPALSRSGDTDTGIWYPAANTWAVSTAGAERLRIDSAGLVGIGTTTPQTILQISNTTSAQIALTDSDAAADTKTWSIQSTNGLFRIRAINDAYTDGINTLVMTRTGIASVVSYFENGPVGIGLPVPLAKLHVTPAASGTDYFRIDHSDGTPRLQVGVLTGADLYGTIWVGNIVPTNSNWLLTKNSSEAALSGPAGGILSLGINGSNIWNIVSAGHLLANVDNTYDIGASGANRPRNIDLAGNLTAGGLVVGTFIYSSNAGNLAGFRAASDGVMTLFDGAATSFGRLQFGGTTSSFPSIKRSSATLQARLADDSAFADVSVASIRTNNAAALVISSVAMNNGAAAALGTLTDAPAAGNPTKWIPIDDNGTTRYIPTW